MGAGRYVPVASFARGMVGVFSSRSHPGLLRGAGGAGPQGGVLASATRGSGQAYPCQRRQPFGT